MKHFFTLVVLGIILSSCASGPAIVPEIVWPEPPDQARFKLVDILTGKGNFKESTTTSIRSAFLGEKTGDKLKKPYGIAVDDSGTVYVADSELGFVVVFDNVENRIRHIGRDGRGKLLLPIGITIIDSTVLVSDTKLGSIFCYSLSGKYLYSIGEPGDLARPSGIAYDKASDRIYVIDAALHLIRVFSYRDRELLFDIGSRGSGEAQFNFPNNIAVRNDKIYVSDAMNFRIQILDLEGNYINSFGEACDGPGCLFRPKGIAVTRDGFIFIVDSSFNNFQVFDELGQVYMFVGQSGAAPGQFLLPAGIHVDSNERVYVSDQTNSRVQVFQFLGSD